MEMIGLKLLKCLQCPSKFSSTCCEKNIHPSNSTHHNDTQYVAGKIEIETDKEPTNCLCEFTIMKWCVCRIKKG